MTTEKQYGVLIREARRGKGWTLDKLSQSLETSFSVSYLGEVERGSRAPLDVTATHDIAQVLGIPPAVLLDARARYQERSTLPLGLRPDQDAAALHLGRVWRSLGVEQVRQIMASVESA